MVAVPNLIASAPLVEGLLKLPIGAPTDMENNLAEDAEPDTPILAWKEETGTV